MDIIFVLRVEVVSEVELDFELLVALFFVLKAHLSQADNKLLEWRQFD